MPISEHGGLVALLYLNHATARDWKPEELVFIREVAERTRTAVERRRAEQDLQQLASSLERQVAARTADLDRVWRNSRDLLVIIGSDGLLHAVNPAWPAVLGHAKLEVIGRSFSISSGRTICGSQSGHCKAPHRSQISKASRLAIATRTARPAGFPGGSPPKTV